MPFQSRHFCDSKVSTTAHAHKSGVTFHIFSRPFKQKKKKIKKLRPKKTKIHVASRVLPYDCRLHQLRTRTFRRRRKTAMQVYVQVKVFNRQAQFSADFTAGPRSCYVARFKRQSCRVTKIPRLHKHRAFSFSKCILCIFFGLPETKQGEIVRRNKALPHANQPARFRLPTSMWLVGELLITSGFDQCLEYVLLHRQDVVLHVRGSTDDYCVSFCPHFLGNLLQTPRDVGVGCARRLLHRIDMEVLRGIMRACAPCHSWMPGSQSSC